MKVILLATIVSIVLGAVTGLAALEWLPYAEDRTLHPLAQMMLVVAIIAYAVFSLGPFAIVRNNASVSRYQTYLTITMLGLVGAPFTFPLLELATYYERAGISREVAVMCATFCFPLAVPVVGEWLAFRNVRPHFADATS